MRKEAKPKKVQKERIFNKYKLLFFLPLILIVFILLLNRLDNAAKNRNTHIMSPSNITYKDGMIPINVSCPDLCHWMKERIDDGDMSNVFCGEGKICQALNPDNESFFEVCTGCYGSTITGVKFGYGVHNLTLKFIDYIDNGTVKEERVIFEVKTD